MAAQALTVTSSCRRATTIWPSRASGVVHGEKVAVEDAGVDHREAAHAQQKSALGENRWASSA